MDVLRNQELNLLMVFDAIMTEGSITRAADRLALSQPAVSNALSRMRLVWKDELFVKDGRNIQPTAYAQNLWAQIREPLQQLGDAVDQNEFNPATAKRTFRIAVADAIVDVVWRPLRKVIEQSAPGINIHAVPYTISNAESLLHDADVDMLVGAQSSTSNVIRTEFLFNPCYACVMRLDHPLTKVPLTLERFAAADHLLVSLSGEITGYTDQVLAQKGMKRRVAMTVNHFATVPALLKETDLITVIPSSTVEQAIFNGELAVMEPPIDIAPTSVGSAWHKRQENDKGLCWLRGHVNRIIKEHYDRHMSELKARICPQCKDAS
ncbi:LysR family transcriptional regulator [Corallincola luteus]|uniref:LysR family transcriptional regulator n=1 Tax=Corallincola luteus TaxID=1775177 RepID=UPI001F104851|nr:LysR family transcriptional regulator [Corallincola luteus]